ncbi:hypothetical protein OsJ_14146 [Oryza sativa Japonica Group]|uniref:Uncharacterized protein n=1 Tax=Oryza sativa subsp. japonica TaxID=39947 RepID=A3ARZ5_ORYSJ|nr:hypothetical protein OsJ_14146 [Oryza sativa Japonica Group]
MAVARPNLNGALSLRVEGRPVRGAEVEDVAWRWRIRRRRGQIRPLRGWIWRLHAGRRPVLAEAAVAAAAEACTRMRLGRARRAAGLEVRPGGRRGALGGARRSDKGGAGGWRRSQSDRVSDVGAGLDGSAKGAGGGGSSSSLPIGTLTLELLPPSLWEVFRLD